jgi:hypothetical protein
MHATRLHPVYLRPVLILSSVLRLGRSRDSSGHGLDRGFESRQGLGIFVITTASRPALGPTQPPIQWVSGALSLGVKRPRREVYHPHTSSAEVKECVELYLHSLNTPSWRAQLKSTGTTLPLPDRRQGLPSALSFRFFK